MNIAGNIIQRMEQFNYRESLSAHDCSIDSEINQEIRNTGKAVSELKRRVLDNNNPKIENKNRGL